MNAPVDSGNRALDAVKYGIVLMQNEAIQKGYAEIRVVDGERKFQWK